MGLSIKTGTVGNFTSSIRTGWHTVNFEAPFPAGVTPVVFAQIQTRRGPDTPGIRLQNVSNTGFQVRMDEIHMSGTTSSSQGALGQVKSDERHPAPETLGWIAIN